MNGAAAATKMPVTVGSVLRCDSCGQSVGTEALLTWDPDGPCNLRLVHNAERCDSRKGYSCPASWLRLDGDNLGPSGLERLAAMSADYPFTRDELVRLTHIAWAVNTLSPSPRRATG